MAKIGEKIKEAVGAVVIKQVQKVYKLRLHM